MGSNKWTRELPDHFCLTAEVIFQNMAYQNKQWVLTRRGVNPPAITIRSDPDDPNGSINIFSRYRIGNLSITDPKDFIKSPEINDFSHNWIQYSYSPLDNIDIKALCWLPNPSTICGALRMNNTSTQEKTIHVDLVGQLAMKSRGMRLKGIEFGGRDILYGKLGSEDLILFLSGNTKINPGPYPCLTSEYSLTPDKEENLRWIAILGSSPEESQSQIKRYIDLDWEGEVSRSKISRQSRIEILTKDNDWNFAVALTQKEAFSFCIKHLLNRTSDQDPARYLTPFQAMGLFEALSPVDQDLGLLIIENTLQGICLTTKNGAQSSSQNIQPPDFPLAGELLMELVDLHGTEFIDQRIIDLLESSHQQWFFEENDKDQDGIPELTTPSQFALIDPVRFEGEIQLNKVENEPYLESPGLAAFLVNDLTHIESLLSLSESANSNHSYLTARDRLKNFIDESWNQEDCVYYPRDRDTHLTLPGTIIHTGPINGFQVLKHILLNPSRIGILMPGEDIKDQLSRLQITLHGVDASGLYRIEELSFRQVQFIDQYGWGISETSFQSLDYLTVIGLSRGQPLVVYEPQTKREDITHLLPLWGGSIDKSRAGELIENTIMNQEKYWSPFGLRSYPELSGAVVQLPWNVLVGRGLLNFGERKIAAGLFTNLIKAMTKSLKSTGAFYSAYHSNTGKGVGLQNSPDSLVPIGFFLRIIGVRILPDREIRVEGEYPFSWPIKVRYRGYLIHRDPDQTRIVIPGQEPQILKGSGKLIIPLH